MITPQQTEQLFLFTKKKMVHYYDLQVELVDHLANMIEEIMENDPKISFDSALKKAYASFGLFGFAHIVQQKENALQIKYKKMWWKEMKNQFRWPEIIFSALLVLVTWTALELIDMVTIGIFFFIGWLTCQFIEGGLMRQNRKNGKKLLMLQFAPEAISLFNLFYQFFGWTFVATMNPYIITIIFVAGILVQIATFRLLLQVRNEARQQFPEAFLKTA